MNPLSMLNASGCPDGGLESIRIIPQAEPLFHNRIAVTEPM